MKGSTGKHGKDGGVYILDRHAKVLEHIGWHQIEGVAIQCADHHKLSFALKCSNHHDGQPNVKEGVHEEFAGVVDEEVVHGHAHYFRTEYDPKQCGRYFFIDFLQMEIKKIRGAELPVFAFQADRQLKSLDWKVASSPNLRRRSSSTR
jgi:hypothetical protein